MAWSVLQSASGSASASTVPATFTTANVQAGNKIIAVVSVGATTAPAVTSVKDAALNTWTQVGNANQANGRVYIFALDVPAGDVGTKPTLTATSSGTPGLGIEILEVSGLLAGNTTAMCDGSAGTLTGTAASTGSPTYSSSAANEFLLSAYGDFGSGNTVVLAGGWTPGASNVNSSTNSNCLIQYKNSTGGAETDGFTTADAGGWAVAEIAFLLGVAAGPSVGQRDMPQRAVTLVSNSGWRGAGHSRLLTGGAHNGCRSRRLGRQQRPRNHWRRHHYHQHVRPDPDLRQPPCSRRLQGGLDRYGQPDEQRLGHLGPAAARRLCHQHRRRVGDSLHEPR